MNEVEGGGRLCIKSKRIVVSSADPKSSFSRLPHHTYCVDRAGPGVIKGIVAWDGSFCLKAKNQYFVCGPKIFKIS